ncbi:MAG TPA: hypothetical protein VFJ48_11245 [Casimicrobiaceae bacterium]|nr:hypothetical protein [Casimicrobiaceae bacterium]
MRDHAPIAAARSLLDVLDGAFKAAVATLASLCAKDGKLDDALLDDQQWASYEPALAAADLLAARTLLDAGAKGTDVDAMLASAFTTEAIVGVANRLQGVRRCWDSIPTRSCTRCWDSTSPRSAACTTPESSRGRRAILRFRTGRPGAEVCVSRAGTRYFAACCLAALRASAAIFGARSNTR